MTEYERFAAEEPQCTGRTVAAALTFLFIGVGIGAVTALFLAPKSGRQMRRMIKRKYEDARESIDDFADQAGDWAEDVGRTGSKYAKTGAKWAARSADWAKDTGSKVAKVRHAVVR